MSEDRGSNWRSGPKHEYRSKKPMLWICENETCKSEFKSWTVTSDCFIECPVCHRRMERPKGVPWTSWIKEKVAEHEDPTN